jgi:hypothetical protein
MTRRNNPSYFQIPHTALRDSLMFLLINTLLALKTFSMPSYYTLAFLGYQGLSRAKIADLHCIRHMCHGVPAGLPPCLLES